MLVLFSDECKFEDSHMHGGYRFGNDSNWNKTDCISVYCDSGYIHNKISNFCIKFPNENNDENPKDNKTWIIIVSVIGGVVVLAVIVTIIIMHKKKVLCFNKSNIKNNSTAGENLVPETNN